MLSYWAVQIRLEVLRTSQNLCLVGRSFVYLVNERIAGNSLIGSSAAAPAAVVGAKIVIRQLADYIVRQRRKLLNHRN